MSDQDQICYMPKTKHGLWPDLADFIQSNAVTNAIKAFPERHHKDLQLRIVPVRLVEINEKGEKE